jgi:hypothetical protein
MSEQEQQTTQQQTQTNEPSAGGNSFREGLKSDGPDLSFMDKISQEYKETPTIKNIKSIDDMAKQLVHANKKIGERLSEPEEVNEDFFSFYSKLGRPENPDDYKLEVSDELKELGFDEKNFKETAHAAGLTAKQANLLFDKYSKDLSGGVEANKQKIEARDQDFSKLAVDTFGSEDEWSRASAEVQEWIVQNVPSEIRATMSELGNKELLTIIQPLKTMLDKMNNEDQPLSKSQTPNDTGSDNIIDLKKEMAAVYNDPEYKKDERLQQKYLQLTSKLMKLEQR